MSKESWFRAFERNLAENGWLDHPERDDLYEAAGKAAFDELLNRDPPEEEE